jgi:hypothetical protein
MKRTVGLGMTVALAGVMALAIGVNAQDPGHPAHPGHIHVGVCPQPGDVAVPLADAAPSAEAPQGLTSAIPVRVSITTVEMPLADILASEHSINYHESADTLDVYIACGDIGGPIMDGADVAIGLADQNGSGHSGIAWLHDNGDDTTTVYVFLMEGYPAPATTTTTASPAPAMSPAAPEASPAAPEASAAAPMESPAASVAPPAESAAPAPASAAPAPASAAPAPASPAPVMSAAPEASPAA